MQVKNNQKKLLKHCREVTKTFYHTSKYQGYDPQNKRNEKKFTTVTVYKFNQLPKGIDYLSDHLDPHKTKDNTGKEGDNTIWRKHIKTIIKVEKQLEKKDMKESKVDYIKTKDKKTSKEKIQRQEKAVWNTQTETTRYYISTTSIPNAEEFNRIIREHWEIENSNHGVRDNTLEEDKSRIRKNPGAMARIRSLVLNILAYTKQTKNIRQAIKQNQYQDSDSFFRYYEFLW